MWDQRYQTQEYVYGTEPNDFLRHWANKIPKAPKGEVLCLAEGEGRNAVYLAELGYQVTAVDSSKVGLQKAQQLAESRGVEIQTEVADLAEYSIEQGRWQGIISIFCHLPPALRAKVHQQTSQGLAENGVFILEAYHPHQLHFKTGGPPVSDLMVTLEDLETELTGLKFEHFCYTEREVNEGHLHQGKAAVVQCIASRGSRDEP